ncbi:hypothetical protein ZWY2020_050006 [Hordeum vulgare]|nr:hypothetical protein ZWY2020_050006 [Hordeum vulgare]
MPLMAVSSPLPFSFPSARHPRRAAAGAAAAPSATASDDFDYPLADPSVRWPSLRFPHLPAPRFPAADAAPPPPHAPARPEPAEEGSSAPSPSGPSAVAVEPLDARAHRGRLKKLSKVALRRARDWRERVSDLTDRLLALPPGAPVAEVLDDAWASPDELAYVVRAVGAASWRRALDAFEWLAASGDAAPPPRVVAVVLGVLGRARQDGPAEEVFLRFAGEGATVQVFNAMMGVYARSGRFDDVRQLLDAMRGQGIEPDLVSFNTLINASAKSGCLAPGAAFDLLHEVRQAGLRPDVITYNTLISACSQGSILDDAVAVFEEMIDSECRPDLWTYNAMVSVHGRCGTARDAEQMFMELLEKGFKPDAVTYLSFMLLAKEMSTQWRLDLALGLYDEMRAIGCTPDAVTYTVLIDSLGKVDRISDAGKAEADEAEQTFDRMVAPGVKPDRLAYLVMLDIIARSGETKKLMALYRTMMKDGYVPDDTLYQVMLAALAKGNEHEEIEGVMQDMEVVCQMDRQLVYGVLIKAGCISQGAKLLKKACLQGNEPDSKSLLSILDAYETTGKHEEGLSLLQCIREHVPSSHNLISECSIMLLCKIRRSLPFKSTTFIGVEPSQKIYESMISTYCKLGFPETAHQLMDEAVQCGVWLHPLSSRVAIIEAYGRTKLWQHAENFVKGLNQDAGVDRRIWNALIHAYAESGLYEQARAVFDIMIKKGPVPTVDSINGMMRALIIDGRLDELFVVVQELQDMGFKISKSTVILMLEAFAKAGDVFEVMKIYNGMKEAGYLPNMHIYRRCLQPFQSRATTSSNERRRHRTNTATMHILMTSYGTAGHPVEAEKVLNSLKSSSLEVSSLPYSTVLTLLEKWLLTERTPSLLTEVDSFLEELEALEDSAALNFVNALEDLLWAFERRATASYIFQLAVNRNIYRHACRVFTSIFNSDFFVRRVIEKDWGADFRKLSAGAALVAVTLWLDQMQDASLQGSPESPKSIVLVTGEGEYNMVSLRKTIRAYLLEMGSPFLPCRARTGRFVAKFYSLKMWLKDSPFCMDLELKDAPALPKMNSMKLTEGYFMRAGLVSTFKDIHEQLGEVRPKKFSRLAMLSEESRAKFIKADIKGRKDKLERIKEKGLVIARKSKKGPRRAKFVREQIKEEVLK